MDLECFYKKYGKDNVKLALKCKNKKDVENFCKEANVKIDEEDLSKLLEHIKVVDQKKVLDLDELESISGGKEKEEQEIVQLPKKVVETNSNNNDQWNLHN